MIEPGVVFSTGVYSVIAGSGVGFSFLMVRWLANFIAGRVDRKEDRVDAGMRRLLEDLQGEVGRLKEECASLREGLADCHRKHFDSEEEVARLRGLMQGYGDARQLAQLNSAADKVRETKR
jgi:hypothetical protein